jgi:hypothetical protein
MKSPLHHQFSSKEMNQPLLAAIPEEDLEQGKVAPPGEDHRAGTLEFRVVLALFLIWLVLVIGCASFDLTQMPCYTAKLIYTAPIPSDATDQQVLDAFHRFKNLTDALPLCRDEIKYTKVVGYISMVMMVVFGAVKRDERRLQGAILSVGMFWMAVFCVYTYFIT